MSNYLDTRDLAKRLEELQGFQSTLEDARSDREEIGACPASTQTETEEADKIVQDAESDFGESEAEELKALEELESEVTEWRYGNTLIPESDFNAYARQTAEDLGLIDDNAKWPCNCIDWEQAADELKVNYSCVTFQGEDYFYRA